MKVQTKITLLLVLVVATFLVGLLTFRAYDRAKFRRVTQERFIERNRSFEEVLNRNGESLKNLAEDYTYWDQMVAAIAANDQQWLTDNVSADTLASFRANSVWIFRPDGTLLYARNNRDAPELEAFPVRSDDFPRVFATGPLTHFFVECARGIMEIRGGTVHPSRDFRRQTAPQGYFFAGRLWNDGALDELSMFSGNSVSLVVGKKAPRGVRNDNPVGAIGFTRPLRRWDGETVAHLIIRNTSPIVEELHRSGQRQLLSLVIFALVLLLLISVALGRLVRRPLRKIMTSLESHDPTPIEPMCGDNSEFGELARTVHKFFEQRDNLIREMDERRATEEALRESEDELRHSQKMEAVGRLAGGIAHDFNNLLTAIIGYAELLSSRAVDDPHTRQQAGLIRKAGEQAAMLTRQLLAFSRKQILQPKVIDLNHLVTDIEQLLRRVIGERFDLQTKPEAVDGRVKADPHQIEQVILNLGVNARDAMPTGGTLVIQTCNQRLSEITAPQISASIAPGDYVVLSVTDTGAGMDEETKARIFEPFFTTKGPGKGTGLGLATVYGIVRQSGGGISVESEISAGSTFRIYLPLERAPVDYIKPVITLPEGSNSETVMVVEDEEIVRELVCDVLEEQGYHVVCAKDGQEALELAENFVGKIDLLVTDVIMPHMNGQEVAEILCHRRPDLKVLFVSGYSDTDLNDHGILDPGIQLLQKPFTPHALAQKIREVMRADEEAMAPQLNLL